MYQVNFGIGNDTFNRLHAKGNIIQPQASFPVTAPQDVFHKTPSSNQAHQKVSFGRWFSKDPAQALIDTNPELRIAVNSVIEGKPEAITEIDTFLARAIAEQDLNSNNIRALATHIRERLIKSAYKNPTQGKAQALVRMHGIKEVINDRLEAYNDYAKSFLMKLFSLQTRQQAAYTIAQSRKILNEVLVIPDDKIRNHGRNQIKASLIGAINSPDQPEFAKDHALNMLLDGDLIDRPTELLVFKRQIEKPDNTPFLKLNAIQYLPRATKQFAELSKETIDADQREQAILECTATLYRVLTGDNPQPLKRAAESAIEQITSENFNQNTHKIAI